MVSILRLNGRDMPVRSGHTAPLIDVLRDELGDRSPKPGCREGRCGACTVLLDGEPVLSCLVPLGRALDTEVTTVAGGIDPLATADPELARIQEAFGRAGAVQCGICSTGMMLATRALLAERPHATEQETTEALANNLCRCTGYQKILEAVAELANEEPSGAASHAQQEAGVRHG